MWESPLRGDREDKFQAARNQSGGTKAPPTF
jgi:hypothetical protein